MIGFTLESHERCEKASLIIAAGGHRDRSLEESFTPSVVARLQPSWFSKIQSSVYN
jgi:hypothetical protein